MESPKLSLTVTSRLWDAMAEACGGPFADSYLSGATESLDSTTLTTKTRIAFDRLSQRGAAMAVFEDLGIELRPPAVATIETPYERMTLAEKIRHHTILATEAEMKAGPMWRGGKDGFALSIAQMPPAWHEWKAKAAFHYDEIRSLRGWKALARIERAPRPDKPPVAMRSTHGPVDATGITAEMRAILARQQASQ